MLQLAAWLWQDLPPGELLYPGSPAVYRRRWDALLAKLKIPASVKLTPGSLRAGGAIAAFQKGLGVNDLLWRMRLKSLSTLEYYLQEMSAISILPSLDPATRRRISAASLLFLRQLFLATGPLTARYAVPDRA